MSLNKLSNSSRPTLYLNPNVNTLTTQLLTLPNIINALDLGTDASGNVVSTQGLLSSTVVLTDTQIKSTSGSIVIVPAPATLNQIIYPLYAVITKSFIAGYTNGGSALGALRLGTDTNPWESLDACILNTGGVRTFFSSGIQSTSVNLTMNFTTSGTAYTGGNAANTLSVTVFYKLVQM